MITRLAVCLFSVAAVHRVVGGAHTAPRMSGRLAGKTALITGAARGQGFAEAQLFVRSLHPLPPPTPPPAIMPAQACCR